MSEKESAEKKIRNIRRKTRKKYSAEEKIRIVLEGLRGDECIAELCRREGLSQSMYYKWSKDTIESVSADAVAAALMLAIHWRRNWMGKSKQRDLRGKFYAQPRYELLSCS